MTTDLRTLSLAGRIRAFLTPRRLLTAAMTAGVLTALLGLMWGSPGVESVDHWTGDMRARLQARQFASEHPRVALVTIDEELMLNEPVRSPLNREMVARIVSAVAAAKPAAIGLDFIFDQPSAAGDRLAETIRQAAQAGVPIVMGTLHAEWHKSRPLPKERLAAQQAFLAQAGNPPTGHLYLREERDGIVRARSVPPKGVAEQPSFAAVLAQAGGAPIISLERMKAPGTALRVDWLGKPRDGSFGPFVQIPAAQMIGGVAPDMAPLLVGRVVLIGADLIGMDQHRTPLTSPDETVPGVMVHAHIAAQILDNRHFRLLPTVWALCLTFLAANVGVLLGWGWPKAGLLTGAALLLPYFMLDWALVNGSGIVVPFIAPLLSWGGGIMIGEAMQMFEGLPGKVARAKRRIGALLNPGPDGGAA